MINLQNDGVLQNDDHEENGRNSRACGSESASELGNESNGGTLNGENETNKEGNGSQHIGNEQINTKGTPSSNPNTVSPAPVQVNVQYKTIKAWIGSGEYSNSYAGKLVHNDNEANKLIHIPTVLNDKGLQSVIESGPWIVNSKHMVVQKWDPSVNLDKKEPTTLPLWIKIMSPPLEAWSNKGMSALASRIGSPLIMDAMTTRTCTQGFESLGYDRVLVEATIGKRLDDHINVLYKNKDNGEQFVKKVRVEYDWKPPSCSHCKVFRHFDSKCLSLEPRKLAHKEVKDGEGFIYVGRKKRYDNGEKINMQNKNKPVEKKHGYQKFLYDNGKRGICRTIISMQRRSMAIRTAISKWSKGMMEYFKQKRKVQYEKDKNADVISDEDTNIELDENDVYVDKTWNIRGLGKLTKQNEVKNLIWNERLSIYAILETHMKKDRIDKVCMNIFGSWSWQHNESSSMKGCRITVGWDCNNVKCSLKNTIEQSMLYNVEVLSSKESFFCTFIYAANKAWVIMGDVNVRLNLEDHSEDMSNFTQDMIDFQECVNDTELEDINSYGLHFTWTKSLLNPNATVIKKIDRIMSNQLFLS
nr:hypothetical protein [Tanacetum cinerariifolium]